MTNAPTQKVLIIEDDESMLGILSEKIAAEGFTVIKAADGQQGLQLALSEKPDLILLDLLLPKLPGLDMLNELRKHDEGKDVPVLILTNLTENSAIYKSIMLNTAAYFIKSDSSLEYIAGEVKNKLLPKAA